MASKGQIHSPAGKLGKSIWSGIADGRIPYREEIVDRLEKVPEAFIGDAGWHNFGKAIVRVASAQAEQLVPPDEEGGPPGRSETILVGEDDEPLRELAVCILQDAGYRVIEDAETAPKHHPSFSISNRSSPHGRHHARKKSG